jgi:hypothetical protein
LSIKDKILKANNSACRKHFAAAATFTVLVSIRRWAELYGGEIQMRWEKVKPGENFRRASVFDHKKLLLSGLIY